MATNRNPHVGSGVRAGRPAPSVPASAATAEETLPQSPRGPIDSWLRFWFTPINPVGLHCIRVLSGLLFIVWLLPFAGQVDGFFGAQGWLDREAYRELSRNQQKRAAILSGAEQGTLPEQTPPLGWSLLYLVWENPGALHAFYWGSLAVFLLFALGLCTRITSILTWLSVVSFLANPVLRFEADFLLAILALYLMLGYGLQGFWTRRLSVAEKILGPRNNFVFDRWLRREGADRDDEPRASYAANLAVRLLQVHFALIVVVSGLHKLQFGPWWGGWAIFYPLHSPFDYTFDTFRARMGGWTTNLVVLSLIQYVWMAWQLAFPAFAWRTGWLWRTILLGGGVIGWIGSFVIYGLPLFGPIYLIGCLSFLTVAEWQWLGTTIKELAGHWGAGAEAEKRVRVGSSS